MLVGIWTTGSNLEMPVVLFCFFVFFFCPYPLSVANDGSRQTGSIIIVCILEFQKQKAREAFARMSMCAYSDISHQQKKVFLSDSSACAKALSQVFTYTYPIPGKK